MKKLNGIETQVKVLVIGSGAAGLNAALQLFYRGIDEILIITEGLSKGTSINTGSDKQTYYKLSLCGDALDSPAEMAESYFSGGGIHGDLALVESALSVQAFSHLVQLGVPFPTDAYGQFIGYKTDYDDRQRATSIGPYTSKKMCECLSSAVTQREIPIRECCEAISLLVENISEKKQIYGAIILNENNDFEVIFADYVIFAVGGPGGLYRDSVYPLVHSGAIGLALMAGAKARNLQESQFGLASTKFRWNVSGTYMQVIPRVISTAQDGVSDVREFLLDGFSKESECYSNLFLKGYQWPFDARKVPDGSSLIDLLVYHEQHVRGRRVFLDYRENPKNFDFEGLSTQAFEYLSKSKALFGAPIDRLEKMNPKAVEIYLQNGIDLHLEPLEIAVCAQHNNGGLAGDLWWESENIKNLYPIGEVNGSHGVARPGGAALNAGQVGGFRAASMIAYREKLRNETSKRLKKQRGNLAIEEIKEIQKWMDQGKSSLTDSSVVLSSLQKRMSIHGGFFRELDELFSAKMNAWKLVDEVFAKGMRLNPDQTAKDLFCIRQLCFAHAVYLDSIHFCTASGVGSRGSALITGLGGQEIHALFPEIWKKQTENQKYQEYVLESEFINQVMHHEWIKRREIPNEPSWFERDWAAFRNDEIFEE